MTVKKTEKAWYLSKGVWGGVITFVAGGLTAVGTAYDMAWISQFGQALVAMGIGLGIVGVRAAKKQLS